MKKFMDKNFLLENRTAISLFEKSASHQPIYDFHCHLIPSQIAENKKFDNLTEMWLGGDHYKWRQMRTFGIDENCITGSAEPFDKFLAWTDTVENLVGNPLYHWTHLELQRYFGIYEQLNKKSAPAIWKEANAKLLSDELSVKGIFEKFRVHAVCTTDDPADSLEYHRSIAQGTAIIGKIETKVIPSYRPDKALNIDLPGFPEYISKLADTAAVKIDTVSALVEALVKRLDFFVLTGCKASDHALEYPPFRQASEAEIEETFKKALSGQTVTKIEADAFRTKMLTELAHAYAKRGIVMQLHLAAIRNNNTSRFKEFGPDTGFDAAHDQQVSAGLASLLDNIDATGELPKMILYTLNPKDYYPLGTLMGCFQGGGKASGKPGKIQLGSAWWFCDHRDGIEEQLRILGNLGMLSTFVGMLTDSRSFLSYTRHEYFRRVLCNLLGTWVEKGEFPAEKKKLSEIVEHISFGNAKEYFN